MCGKVLASNTVTATNNVINYAIPQDITLMPIVGSVVGIQVIGNNGENIIKSPIVEAYIGSSLQDSTVIASDVPPSTATQIEQLMAAKHTHDNKSVLDKFAEADDGKPTYNGMAIGGGGGGGSTGSELFIVNVQAQSEAGAYTITSHDKTYEQIDVAYKAGKKVWMTFTITDDENAAYLIPLVSATGAEYDFSMFLGAVFTVTVDSTDTWGCYIGSLEAEAINAKISADTSAESQSLQRILNYMVYPAVEKAHEHSNMSVLNGLSDSNGALKYNSHFITTQKISEGSNITLDDNTEYRLTDITTLTLTYPTGDFECWLRLSFATSGTITVTLPADTKYIGTAPDFKNGETWELSFKDKVLAAQKVGEGT